MTRNARWLPALLVAVLGTLLLAAPAGLAQDDPSSRETASDGPKPGAIGEPAAPIAARHVYDMADLLNAEQEAAIEADATRLQRFGVPAVIIVQFNELSPNAAASFAAEVRHTWRVESEQGADDGLVMLISVPASEGAISTTLSWGDRAFPNDGLAEPVAATIETEWLDARVADGQLYQGIVYSLRRMIYHSIYHPAPLEPRTNAQRIVNITVDIVGPLLALGAIALAIMELRAGHPRRVAASPILIWGTPAAALAIAVAAIWSRSGCGMTAAIALLAVVAVLWVRRDPAARGGRRDGGAMIERFSRPTQTIGPARARAWLAIPALLFLLSLALNLNDVPATEFHPDESRWLNRAHYLEDLLDPFGPTWEDQYLTRGQPPFGSYLMGMGLLLQGRDTATNGVWDFAYGADWNRISGAVPTPADLKAGRRTNAVVAAVTVGSVFFIGKALAGTVAGAAGGLLLAIHPLHIWIGSQALSDQLLNLLIALAILTAIRLGHWPGRGKALLLGILLGLGGAAKLSPLLLSAPVALYGLALLLARASLVDRTQARRLAPLLVVQPVITAITFVVSYPYLWPSPIARTINLFELRTKEMASQAEAWPDVAIAHPGEALVRIYDRLTWQFSATGNLAEGLLRRFGVETDVWGIDLVLAAAGIAVLTWLVIRRGLTSGTALAAYILAGQVGGIIVGMQVDFYRYHLPITLGVAVLAGIAAQAAWDLVASRARASAGERQGVPGSTGHPIQTGSQ